MATPQYPEYPVAVPGRSPYFWSWAGIFSGAFVYVMIETTFGLLGAAIWSSASPTTGGIPTTPLTATGFQVWMVVLTIIALYFAGKTSSKLLYGGVDRNLGMYHGFVTFGMCVVTTLLVIALATAGSTVVYTGAAAPMHSISLTGYIGQGAEWWLFVTFVLSMIAAAFGGMHGVRNTRNLVDERNVIAKRAA